MRDLGERPKALTFQGRDDQWLAAMCNLRNVVSLIFLQGYFRGGLSTAFEVLMQSDQAASAPGAFRECQSMLWLNWVFRVVLSACEFMIFRSRWFWRVWEQVVFQGMFGIRCQYGLANIPVDVNVIACHGK